MSKFISNIRVLTTLQKWTIVVSLLLLIAAFTQPAFYLERPNGPEAWRDTFSLFFFGWLSFFTGEYVLVLLWLANPLYILSIFLTIKGKPIALFFAFIAIILAFAFMEVDYMVVSESGHRSKVTALGYGYFIWFAAILTLTGGIAITTLLKANKEEKLKEAAAQSKVN